MKRILFLLIAAVLMNVSAPAAHAQALKEVTGETKLATESERARLAEARECVKDNIGATWKHCRYDCVDICNDILETYARGVCNGVLIQLCCAHHPSECE